MSSEDNNRTVKILVTLPKPMHSEIRSLVECGKTMSVAEFLRGAAEQKLKEHNYGS